MNMYLVELTHYKDFEGYTCTETFDMIEEEMTAEEWYHNFIDNGNTLDFYGEIEIFNENGESISTFWVDNDR
jgi:hypothetical protein